MENKKFFLRIAIFFCTYLFSFVLLRHINPAGIIFYQGCYLLFFLFIFFLILDYFLFDNIFVLRSIPTYISFILMSYSFLMTFPVVLDRSITLHMYNFLQKNPGGATLASIRNNFVSEFVDKSRAIDKRIVEQIYLGNITENNGVYLLTEKGKKSNLIFNKMNAIFLINPS